MAKTIEEKIKEIELLIKDKADAIADTEEKIKIARKAGRLIMESIYRTDLRYYERQLKKLGRKLLQLKTGK